MTEEHEQLIEALAAYTLESLEGYEQARVETHVTTCALCTRRLAEYRAVVGALPIALEPVEPPPAAWVAIQTALRPRRPRPRGWATRIARPGWLRAAMWPALAGLVATLLLWNVALQRELARRASGPEVEALARRPGRLVILAGTGTSGASARLLVAADGGHGHLAIAGLKRLPPERTYQLWFVRTGAPTVTGGTFGVDAYGRAWVAITAPVSLKDVHAIMVTEEPAPGSAAPTGTHLLDAQPWQ